MRRREGVRWPQARAACADACGSEKTGSSGAALRARKRTGRGGYAEGVWRGAGRNVTTFRGIGGLISNVGC
jgi:hypothetical protein